MFRSTSFLFHHAKPICPSISTSQIFFSSTKGAVVANTLCQMQKNPEEQKRQSPIMLCSRTVNENIFFHFDYQDIIKDAKVTINKGKPCCGDPDKKPQTEENLEERQLKVEFNCETGEQFKVKVNENDEFKLTELHLHTPSEHVIDKKLFDAEMHIVHKRESKLAVIGILFDKGESSELLSDILSSMPSESGKSKPLVQLNMKPIKHILENHKKVFRYEGSLTTRPYTGNVTWTVLSHINNIGEDQLKTLTDSSLFPDLNARSVRAIRERKVKFNDWSDTIAKKHPNGSSM